MELFIVTFPGHFHICRVGSELLGRQQHPEETAESQVLMAHYLLPPFPLGLETMT